MSRNRKSVISQFLIDHEEELRDLIEKDHMMYVEIVDLWKEKYGIQISTWTVGDFARSKKMKNINNSVRRCGTDNPVHIHPDTISKISNSVKHRWDEGDFDTRINGMTNKRFLTNKNFKMINHYKQKYEYYNTTNVCEHCGKILREGEKYNIHHVDEDHNNMLLTNLEKLCIPCHQKMHVRSQALPFITVEISHELQYGHMLPDYDGKCYFPHGHRGVITLRIRRRIDPLTGFAVDFNELKQIIKTEIDDVLDHEFLNNYMYNPTTENTVLWVWNKLSTKLKGIESISWSEGSKTSVTLTKQDMIQAALTGNIESEWIPEEYRVQTPMTIDLTKDLEYIDSCDDFTIQTTIDNEEDWMWFYKMIKERFHGRSKESVKKPILFKIEYSEGEDQ